MKKTVNLTFTNRAKVVENTPIILPDTLVLEFASDTYSVQELLVVARNGVLTKKYKVHKQSPLDLTEMVREGVLDMTIHLIVHGDVVKSWTVDPILFKSTDQGFVLFDYIKDLERRIAALEEKTKVTL